MEKPQIEKLLTLCGESDRATLAVLYNAWVKKFAAYQRDDSRGNLAEWQAAEKALSAKAAELTARHLPDADRPALVNRSAALRWLKQEHAYKISAGKFSNDEKKGLLVVGPDGTVTESEALAYALRAGLKKTGGGHTSTTGLADMEKLAIKAKAAELEKTLAQTAKLQFEMARDQGLYILKSDARTEIAIKIAMFEAGSKHLFRTHIADWIHQAGGNPKAAQAILVSIFDRIDELLDEFGRMDDIRVLVTRAGADPAGTGQDTADGGIFEDSADLAENPEETALNAAADIVGEA